MNGLTDTLEMYFVKKAPALPKGVKEFLVKIAPWLEIIGVVMTIPAIFAIFGFNAMMFGTPYGGYVAARAGFNFTFAMLFLIISFALMILSIPGLFKRSKMGWNYVFFAVLVNAVYSLLNGQIFSLIVGTILSFYLLFQVKSYYK